MENTEVVLDGRGGWIFLETDDEAVHFYFM